MQYFVNVSFANVYRKPTFHSEIDTQALLWEKLTVTEKIDSFLRVQMEDGYQGWINEYQVLFCQEPEMQMRMVTVAVCDLFESAENQARVVLRVSAGTLLPVIREFEDWAEVLLPDGRKGFAKKVCFLPEFSDGRRGLVQAAEMFVGVPYVWGGKSAFGLDCSGLIQLSFKLLGRMIRRDAWMQFEDAQPVSEDPLQAQPGDLYFFSESGNRITHVGVALGEGRIVHARGMVRYNSLNNDHSDFSPELLRDFVQVKTFF